MANPVGQIIPKVPLSNSNDLDFSISSTMLRTTSNSPEGQGGQNPFDSPPAALNNNNPFGSPSAPSIDPSSALPGGVEASPNRAPAPARLPPLISSVRPTNVDFSRKDLNIEDMESEVIKNCV